MDLPATIRQAAPSDARGIAAVHVASWRATYQDDFPASYLEGLSAEEWASRWHEMLRTRPRSVRVWVAEVAARPRPELVGFAQAGPSRDDDMEAAGEVYALYVAPARLGVGVGRRLFERAVSFLADSGFAWATLWVLVSNGRARRFYEATGWEADGARRPFAAGGVEREEMRYRRRLADEGRDQE